MRGPPDEEVGGNGFPVRADLEVQA